MPTRSSSRRALALWTAVAAAAGLTVAAPAPTSAQGAKKPPRLTVLVTNDDGVAAPGIDAVVEALRALPRTKVIVVAPATNQSATGSPATAVAVFPADSVNHAVSTLGLKPNVVISGVNNGQNLGPISEISDTVGAARQAARLGIPALAVSQQLTDGSRQPEFPVAA